jgi:hypothetical protein
MFAAPNVEAGFSQIPMVKPFVSTVLRCQALRVGDVNKLDAFLFAVH